MRRQRSVINVGKKGSKRGAKKPITKHGTRPYQKDEGGPSWDTKGLPPNTEEIMALIERRPEDLQLFREFLVIFNKDPALQSLSMTEIIDMAEMAMLQEKIMGWMLEIDSPERMEEMRESNKMLKSIWQIKGKLMDKARERGTTGGTFEGISKILDQVDSDESPSCLDSEESNQEVEEEEVEDDLESESS